MWHEGLEEASRTYFADHNTEGMLATLRPLHEMLEKGPETISEISFHQAYGRDLQEAFEWCKVINIIRLRNHLIYRRYLDSILSYSHYNFLNLYLSSCSLIN